MNYPKISENFGSQSKQFLKVLLPYTRLLIEPKIYGVAIAIKYLDGKFD